MSKEIDAMISLGKQLEEQQNAAHDLWSWLPSYKVAEQHHGDYASNFQPSVKDVLTEAALYVACVKDGTQRDYNQEERDWFTRCPCGEEHVGE